ncbi:MAG: 7-cyano-7-deazaguanine synthase QueC [Nitrospirae bacterium]|nr:7-cyano-7-deazaguanine synthase QueC [Nitrospirota bacterium]
MTTSADHTQVSKDRAVVLLSGGLDSSTTLAIAADEGYETFAISFDYHQRHSIELRAAKKIASALGVTKHLVVNFDLREIGGSALTSDTEVPKADPGPTGAVSSSAIPATYVPARNTIFLSFALGWAEVLDARHIFIGANEIDYSGYPDCRPEYLAAFETMANLATKASVEGGARFEIKAPLISLRKSEIIRRGTALGLDYSLTWSCYDPMRIPGPLSVGAEDEGATGYMPCGRCDSCRIREKGFIEAGMTDPLTKLYNSHAA